VIDKSTDPPIIATSTTIYRLLLFAYPVRFQHEYGPQMVQVFRDCCLRAVRQGGGIGVIELWVITLFDLARSVIEEHTHKETGMTNSNFVRLAGWALIGGAAALVIGTVSLAVASLPVGRAPVWGVSVVVTHFLSMPLLMVGLLGVRNRYGQAIGGFGRNILLLGVILAPLLTVGGLFGLGDPAGTLAVLFVIGLAMLLACLALFGIVALQRKPLPRWNAAPLIAGVGYPILVAAYVATFISTGDQEGSLGNWAVALSILCIIQGIALAALGYTLKSDVPAGTVLPA
jgi:hypothetical protein